MAISIFRLGNEEHIATALSSRWSKNCRNVSIRGNEYSILASEVDTYYIMINQSYTMLVGDPEIKVDGADLKTTVLTGGSSYGEENSLQPQTKLVQIKGQIYCPNDLVRTYPSFYVPTMVSAHINQNSRCHRQWCWIMA